PAPFVSITLGSSATNSTAYLRIRSASPGAPSWVDAHVVPIDPAEPLQHLLERSITRPSLGIVLGWGLEYTNSPHPFWLLRTSGERPHSHAADQRNEFAPPH